MRVRLLDRALWQPCRDTVTAGISVGAFFAMMPMPGQTIAAALIAMRGRANVPFAVAACFISNPFTEPFIRVTQHKFGLWLRDTAHVPMPKLGEVDVPFAESTVHLDVSAFILGFLTSGVLLALLAYPLVHLFSAMLPHHLPIHPPKLKRRTPQPSAEHPGKTSS